MGTERESEVREREVRVALQHVEEGRRCIARQLNVIKSLWRRGLPIEQAEEVLLCLEEAQRTHEGHYREVFSNGWKRIELAGARFPAALGSDSLRSASYETSELGKGVGQIARPQSNRGGKAIE